MVKTSHSKERDPLNAYISDIRRHTMLTLEEERELGQRLAKKDERARRRLVESHLQLVVSIARRSARSSVDILDLIQEGNLGLLQAAERFDYRYSVRFSTYATSWIKQAISRAIQHKQQLIRLPYRKVGLLRQIQATYNHLTQELGRTPRAEEVAQEMGLDVKEINNIMQFSGRALSMDEQIEGGTITLGDTIEDSSSSPDREIMDEILQQDVRALLAQLKDVERRVLMQRFAFGEQRCTLKEVGRRLGMSTEVARRTEKRALVKLRQIMESSQ